MATQKIICKRFSSPDETRPFAGHGELEVLKFGEGVMVGKGRFEPGWRWSVDVKPLAKTDSCQAHHLVYVISGSMRIRTDEGDEEEITAGDAVEIAPGHDAWVTGDEPCIAFDFLGVADYAKRVEKKEKEEVYEAPSPIH